MYGTLHWTDSAMLVALIFWQSCGRAHTQRFAMKYPISMKYTIVLVNRYSLARCRRLEFGLGNTS